MDAETRRQAKLRSVSFQSSNTASETVSKEHCDDPTKPPTLVKVGRKHFTFHRKQFRVCLPLPALLPLRRDSNVGRGTPPLHRRLNASCDAVANACLHLSPVAKSHAHARKQKNQNPRHANIVDDASVFLVCGWVNLRQEMLLLDLDYRHHDHGISHHSQAVQGFRGGRVRVRPPP